MFKEGWILGSELTDGDSEGMDEGKPELEGFSKGGKLGQDDGCNKVRPDRESNLLGCDVVQSEI